jgi:hypothetical protein
MKLDGRTRARAAVVPKNQGALLSNNSRAASFA